MIVACLLLAFAGYSQSPTLETLRKSTQARRGIFLYPSTIRMVNVANLASFNELIKGIKKAYFFSLRSDRFDEHDFLKVRAALEDEEGFENYMTIERGVEEKLYVLGRSAENETALLSRRNGKYYMGMIYGQINIVKLMDLQRELKDPGILAENPFLDQLKNMMGSNRDEHKERDSSPEETVDSSKQKKT